MLVSIHVMPVYYRCVVSIIIVMQKASEGKNLFRGECAAESLKLIFVCSERIVPSMRNHAVEPLNMELTQSNR